MPRFEPKVNADGLDRWWSAEISFEPVLDRYFSVRNIKRGAHFLHELRQKVQEKMRPVISQARRDVQETWKENRVAMPDGGATSTEHTEAEEAAKSACPTPGEAGGAKTEEETKKEIEEILSPIIKEAKDLSAWMAKIESQPFTIVDQDEGWKGSEFLDVHFAKDGKRVLEYNRRHEFFVFVYEVIERLRSGDLSKEEAIESAQKLKVAIDLLFMSYAAAAGQSDLDHVQRSGDTLDFLRTNWGAFLRQFVRQYESK